MTLVAFQFKECAVPILTYKFNISLHHDSKEATCITMAVLSFISLLVSKVVFLVFDTLKEKCKPF